MVWQIAPERGGEGDIVSVVREIELGQHTLFIMSDNSIDIVDFEGESYMAENAVNLTPSEVYNLYISLDAHYKSQTGATDAASH